MAVDVSYVQLSGTSSRATLGLYAGMPPQELQQLVCVALQHHEGLCAGFQVSSETSTSRSGRKKRSPSSSSIPRLVPLSVACQAPDLLTGRVSALFAPFSTSQSSQNAQDEALKPSQDVERLQKLLQALESEQKLRSFEAAMLRDLCEQRSAQVLAELSRDTSVDEKKKFLLQILRPAGSGDLQPSRNRHKQQQGEEILQAELLATRVAAIGRRVFSPQVQMQVLALAEQVRHTGAAKNRMLPDTMELLTMVERLLDKHVLPEEHGAHLLELVLDENKVLWSALQSYRKDGGSWSDLESTAKRLAALGCEPPKPIASKKNRGKSPRKGIKQGSSPEKKRARNAAAAAATAAPSAVSVIRSLHAQHMLTSLELDIVKALVEQEDSQVLQTLRAFEQSDHRDVAALRDALVSIVEEITMELGDEEKAAAAFARGMDDAVQEENQLTDSDDDSDSLGWQRHLSFLLGQWQAQHHLKPADANTLRRMVAQRHNLLESAYEVFAGDGDASELLDTLQRVAKLQRQIEQSQTGHNVQNGASASDLSLEDVVHEMQRRGVVQGGDAAGLLVLLHAGNEALQAANEAFQADGDVHELEETLLLVVKHARFGNDAEEDDPVDEGQVVCRLLADFGRSGRLELWQIQLLMSLLKSRDPRLLAAVDVYHQDQDTDELVDTLEILVELAAWERHCRAMVHDWIAPLARSGKLPRGGAERLVQLVKSRDDLIVAALVVFLSDNNKEEFVDTLARIACLEAMKLKHVLADAKEDDESKEGHLVLALLKELEDKGAMTGEEREQVEELVCSGEPRMLAAMDVLAATHDAEDFADTARRVLAKSKEQVEGGDAKEEERDEVNPFSEAAVSSPKTESAANVTESESTLDGDAKDAESDSQIPEKSNEDTSTEGEVEAQEALNELAEPLAPEETKQSDDLGQKEEQQQEKEDEEVDEKDGDTSDTKEEVKEEVKEETEQVAGVKEEVENEQVEQEEQQ